MIATAAALALAALPWISILPGSGPLANTIALLYGFYGWGWMISKGTRATPIVLVTWGVGACLAIGGVFLAARIYVAPVHAAIVYAGCAATTFSIIRTHATTRTRVIEIFRDLRWWIVPVGLLVSYGGLEILGAAGEVTARPFDDDGNVIGQLARIAQTGGLGDLVGYPRGGQLGGQVALLSLVGVLGDLHHVRMLDWIGFQLIGGLAIALIKPRDAQSGIHASLVIVALLAMPIAVDDLAPLWFAAFLLLGLFATLEVEAVPAHVVGLVAAGLVVLRFELAPFAVVVAWLAWRRHGVALKPLVIAFALPILAYAISRALATGIAMPMRGGVALHVVIAIASGLLGWAILVLLERGATGSKETTLAAPCAASLGMISGGVASTFDYGSRFVWSLAVAFIIFLGIRVARRGRTRNVIPFFFAFAACIALYEGNNTRGRFRWYRRILDMASAARFVTIAPRVPLGLRSYGDLLADVPAGSTVAVWVAHPERLDYRRFRIVDVRTPRIPAKRLPGVLADLRPDYVLVEDYPDLLPRSRVITVAHGSRLVSLR